MRVFLTGATGVMGSECLRQMIDDGELYDITVLAIDSKRDRQALKPYMNRENLHVYWGNLLNEDDVMECVRDADLVIHMAALVSPEADHRPNEAMRINLGSTRNIINAIKKCGRQNHTRLVYIGTVAETGDRMPPIHWGRVGDPVKPSIFDYYAVSKVAAEREVIESGFRYWVSLRQTGIMGPAMCRIRDGIMFHNCLDNVLEYVSDRDSGRAMRHLAEYLAKGTLDERFWNHIYNIGGGEKCRCSCYELYKNMYARLGLIKLEYVIEPRAQATRNFHGQYFLDSDKLEEYLHFRHDTMEYFYDSFVESLGILGVIMRIITKLPGGQRVAGAGMKKIFDRLAYMPNGTKRWIKDDMSEYIEAYWGGRESWESIPESILDMKHFERWEDVIVLNHGYDESKAEEELELSDIQAAAKYRGGSCDSDGMEKGNWSARLKFTCAFGHEFEASPRLILEGGHWCPHCEERSWNYGNRARVEPFLAQVWSPLHGEDEMREYPKKLFHADEKDEYHYRNS